MLWCRFNDPFTECDNDYRPVIWPIKYPYWCSGETENSFTIIAYVENLDELYKQWPELKNLSEDITNLETEEVEEVEFYGRFQKPSWYVE